MTKPIPTIETERLILRAMQEPDFDDYLLYATDPQVMQYIAPIGSDEEIRALFQGYADEWDGAEGHWMGLSVVLQETGKVIGDVGFRYKSHEHQHIEIGYKFNKDYHGKGYGFEAVQALVGLIVAQWPFHKLMAFCDPRNLGSVGIMKKLGMNQEAHFKEHFKFGDSWQDELVYSVLKKHLGI